MRALVIYWLIQLLRWAPLAALIAASLGLIALKRIADLPPWIARLTAPPFYLVSLPIATLVAGAEMLGLYSLMVAHFSSGISDGFVFQLFVANVMLVSSFAEFFDYRLCLASKVPRTSPPSSDFGLRRSSALISCGVPSGAKITSHRHASQDRSSEDCFSSSPLRGQSSILQIISSF
jgi:hypothetical protein